MERSKKVLLNDILRFDDLESVKIRFNLMFDDNWNPIEIFKERKQEVLLKGQYWNYTTKKSFKVGEITVGFIRLSTDKDLWLLFHIGRVTKDLETLNGVGYEYEVLDEYEKYFGRLIIRFKNTVQAMVRKAESVIQDCEVEKLLPGIFDNDNFPGYDKVNLSWQELRRVLDKETWRTALQNQKGVYLITDTSNGKMYVGSAYGENMILGRWQAYVATLHGGNAELKELIRDHIEAHFRYSILDIFRSSVDDNVILEREAWWKEVLLTRRFGYNGN